MITVDPNASRCPDCGMASGSVKERTITSPRDIRGGDDPIMLRWNKNRSNTAHHDPDGHYFPESESVCLSQGRSFLAIRASRFAAATGR